MAFNIRNIIFDLFGDYEKQVDINPDANNKGTHERYNESLALDFDTNVLPFIEKIVELNLCPKTALDRFIPYLEERLGVELCMGESLESRRKVLCHIMRWYAIKGTVRAYKLLLTKLGFNVVITEDFTQYSFDSPVTFDDDMANGVDRRRFDMFCQSCSCYRIELTGSVLITPEIVKSIFCIIKFNEPINAKLCGVTYNGNPLVQEIISIVIDANGDLVYNNEYDPYLILTIDANGDLNVDGPNASYYSLNAGGDLIYTI